MSRKLLASAATGALLPRIAAGDGYYDPVTLSQVISSPALAPGLSNFWLNFFPAQVNSQTQKIMFDDIGDETELRLAPFVAPNVQGRVMRGKGFSTRSFRPAYVKPKHVVDPARAIQRRAGEAPLGTLTLQARFDAIVADNLRRERAVIENRWEWMACQAITKGSVVVVGEDYPSVTVAFGRDPALTIVNTGAALWTAGTATVLADIQAARTLAFFKGRAPITKLIFGLNAWTAFTQSNHADVQALLNVNVRGNESLFNGANISDGSPYNYQGRISGTGGIGALDLYTYSNYYEDDTGNAINYLDPGTVVGVGGAIAGVQCFGAILDKRAGLAPVSMFSKLWDEEDPSVTYTMTQSAPLMVPLRPNNSFSLKVA